MENLESHDLGAYWRLQHQTASPAGHDDVTRARWRRLGKLHVVSLSLSSVVILFALTVLGLLWKESMIAISGAEEPRAPWVGALTDNWATTIVTVCTTFIRTAIGFQACSATAMLAGIILEMIGVPLFLAPFFSMLRAMHIAPTSLLSAAAFRGSWRTRVAPSIRPADVRKATRSSGLSMMRNCLASGMGQVNGSKVSRETGQPTNKIKKGGSKQWKQGCRE